MTDSRVEFLRKVSAFSGVTHEGLERLSGICRSVEFKKDDDIIKEGQEGESVYIIEEGEVQISMAITMGHHLWGLDKEAMDKVLVTLGPGAMFGEMAFIFERDVRSATITAMTDCKLIKINSADFHKFAQEDVASAYKIILKIAQIIAERLRKTNNDVKKLTTVLTIALKKPRKI